MASSPRVLAAITRFFTIGNFTLESCRCQEAFEKRVNIIIEMEENFYY
jgi:hypothetical protein